MARAWHVREQYVYLLDASSMSGEGMVRQTFQPGAFRFKMLKHHNYVLIDLGGRRLGIRSQQDRFVAVHSKWTGVKKNSNLKSPPTPDSSANAGLCQDL